MTENVEAPAVPQPRKRLPFFLLPLAWIQPSDPVKNNQGWRAFFFGEKTGFTASVPLAIYFFSSYEPTDPFQVGLSWFLFSQAVAWYANAQSSGVVSATSRRNIGKDGLPVGAMVFSSLPVVTCIIVLALAGWVWGQFLFFKGPEPGIVGLSLPKLAVMSVVIRVCVGDLIHNATMINRAARLNPETTMMVAPAHE